MKNIDEEILKKRIETVVPTLTEYQRRVYLSSEGRSLGRGGVSMISRLSGMSRPTI